MKPLLASSLFALCSSSALAQGKWQPDRIDMAQEILRPGESRNEWRFVKSGQATFRGKRVGKATPSRGGGITELRLSKGSRTETFRYLLWWGVETGSVQSLIWNNSTQSITATFPELPDHQQWEGVFWSPGDKYAVVPKAGELQEGIYVAELGSGRVQYRKAVAPGLKPCEMQALDGQAASWKGPSMFRLTVELVENPWYEGGAKCKAKPRTIVLDVPLE